MNCKAYKAILLFVKKKKKKKQTTKGSRGFEVGGREILYWADNRFWGKSDIREKANTCGTVQQNPVLQMQRAAAIL